MKMKAIITVVGKDQVGIIAKVSVLLTEENVNVLDINQSIMEGFFNMFMIVELDNNGLDFQSVHESLKNLGESIGIEIMMQRTEMFEEMYKISGSSK